MKNLTPPPPLKSLTFILFITLLVLLLSFETCHARHSRHGTSFSVSLYKKKGKHNHQNGSKPKPKPPSPKVIVPPPPPKSKHNSPPPHIEGVSKTFNVLDYGAKGNGIADDTKAFQAAWASACKVAGSLIIVPDKSVFVVGPISFSGPYCQANIFFQLDGTIIAPSDTKVWGNGLLQWLQFTKLVGITIQGNGTIDGRGSPWWQDTVYGDSIDSETQLIVPLNKTVNQNPPMSVRRDLSGKLPSTKPTALRFYGSTNVTVTGITIQQSPQCHLKFDNCVGVVVHDINISSPGDSPNTDGIHLQNTRDVLIHHSTLACDKKAEADHNLNFFPGPVRNDSWHPRLPDNARDDCISIQTGCSNVFIHNIDCGPGHGISIGSLGRYSTRACVSNITVKDVTMHNTMTGVRIKTWQGGMGSVEGVIFSNIQVLEVQLPIVIDQYYCDKTKCLNKTSAVALSGISYEKIHGTYTVKPVHFACSDSLPCAGVTLNSIQLKPKQERYHMYDPFCWKTFGQLLGPALPPINCLQLGKPPKKIIPTGHETC
ncbi:hypothetical protein ACFE04_024922 [Oxalis oulophora]